MGEKAKGPVGAMADPDAGGDFEIEGARVARLVDGEGAAGEISAVVGAGDVHGAGELAGSIAVAFDGADQDAAGRAVGFGDDVQTFVDTVDQIDVGVSGWAEDDASAGRDAAGGVSGKVVEAEVGFDFGDGAGVFAMDEHFAEEVARDIDGGARVEAAGKRAGAVVHRLH